MKDRMFLFLTHIIPDQGLIEGITRITITITTNENGGKDYKIVLEHTGDKSLENEANMWCNSKFQKDNCIEQDTDGAENATKKTTIKLEDINKQDHPFFDETKWPSVGKLLSYYESATMEWTKAKKAEVTISVH